MEAFSNLAFWKTAGLLVCSNIFMTFAWYGHLKNHTGTHWYWVVLISWGIAFFEYLIMVPANRIGYQGGVTLPQLKILQEIITLSTFIPFAIIFMKKGFDRDYIYAGFCLLGAVYFIFRNKADTTIGS